MGLVANSLAPVLSSTTKAASSWQPVPSYLNERAQLPDGRYQTLAREGYMANELIFASIDERATSAAEPTMMVRQGASWTHEHPMLDLLNRPNPFMDRYAFWATVIMHHDIAGNAYALKIRSGSGKVVQLWLIRPDQVRIVPINGGYDRRYEIDLGGGDFIPIPSRDIIQWKTRHPLNDFYGLSLIAVISGRTDTDNSMRDFVKAYFNNAGVPGGVLAVKQSLKPQEKEEIRNRFRNTVGGPRGWHDLLIVDNNEATFTPMTQNLGTRGLVIPELDEIAEARIPMVFGVPQSLIGTRTSYQNGGYANKRAEEQHFWSGTLSPLYKELAGPLNLSLLPDFVRADEIAFDMSDVRALQPDEDAMHARFRADYEAGGMTFEEYRERIGLPMNPKAGEHILLPTRATLVPTPIEDIAPERPEPLALPPAPEEAPK